MKVLQGEAYRRALEERDRLRQEGSTEAESKVVVYYAADYAARRMAERLLLAAHATMRAYDVPISAIDAVWAAMALEESLLVGDSD